MKLLVATGNPGKMKEYRDLLADLNIEWLSLRDVGLMDMEVAETGATFAENAKLKAHTYGQASGRLTLADDSGLVVDALDGAAGIYSARYGAPELVSDKDRYERILSQMVKIPDAQRTARFICVVALALPNGVILTAEGKIEGHIAYAPRGTNGFGYDPIFITANGSTFAELTAEQKNQISHRANALRGIHPLLENLILSQPDN
jgi:XTP/dITP diphosphohydrolase